MRQELRKLKRMFDIGAAPAIAGTEEVGQQDLTDMQMAAQLQKEEFDSHRNRTAYVVHAPAKKVPRVNTLDAFVKRRL